MKRLAALAIAGALALGFPAGAATTARLPDVAVFDASETLVAIAANGAGEGGSTLSVYDVGTGAALSSVKFESRTNGLFFCGSKSLLAWTETAVVRIDPRSGAEEPVMPLAEGERIAVAPRCDSVAIFGAERKEVTVFFLASRRKFAFDAAPGTRAACYSGDESSVVMLATSGALFEGELQKKRRRNALSPAASGDAFGIACFGKHGIAIGGREVEVRHAAGAASGTRVPLMCSLEFRGCAVSADGRTVATMSDESGKTMKALRFQSTSRLKGLATVALTDAPVSVALSPSGASAVATFAQGSPVVVSRATGAHLKLASPGTRIVE
jgi:hypothetical protein